jgi:3-oxoacyl-[acyl-carrier protein] reductase
MADFLVELAQNKRARKMVTTLGLPVPMPQKLERASGPWTERPLHDRTVVVGSTEGATLGPVLADTLTAAGADPWVVAPDAQLGAWEAAGEAWGRPPHESSECDDVAAGPLKPWALVFDATGLTSPDELRALYDFFHPRIRGVARSGRVVVLGRAADQTRDVATAAARRALEGFVRSAGREVGRKGATALLVTVDDGAEDRLGPVLRFLLSPRSAYISGQPVRVSKAVKHTAPRPVRPLEGKVALVTGAARGIGEATAERMAAEGAKVIVLDRPDDDALASEVARRIGGVFLPCDVTADDAVATITDFVTEHFGTLDVVVHNAGVTRDKTLAKMRPELWDLTLNVNLAAVIRITEGIQPILGKDARIVCLSSIAGIAGNVGQTNYSASKAGIIGFVQALGPKLAKKGIAVNAIAPGFIETRLTDAIPVATREVARRLCNLSQGGLPLDIAEVATFLASPGACGLSGQVVRVCGGSFVGA